MADILSYFKNRSNKFHYLTFAIIAWFLLFPFLDTQDFRQIILNILTSAIVMFGIFAAGHRKITVVISLILGLPWFILTWINILILPLSSTLNLIAIVFIILFLAYTAIVILSYILKSTEVSRDILYGAISIYFLIGGTFSTIYMLLEAVKPGSIINNISGVVTTSDLLYFSYITLTTLGYGEIIPVNTYARSLAIIEAIIGVMYIAILISRMVGLFIAKSMRN